MISRRFAEWLVVVLYCVCFQAANGAEGDGDMAVTASCIWGF